jgi:hypothetical protein
MIQREATVERFIGALTMALGVGAMIPRAGFGLYAVLEASGERALWSLLMLNLGALVIVVSYLQRPHLRMLMHVIAIVLWTVIGAKFVNAHLWGAALQAAVVVTFSAASARRLYAMGKG